MLGSMRVLIFIVILTTAAVARAQYDVAPSSIAGGGGASADITLVTRGTVGQSATMAANGGLFSLDSGFWPALGGVSLTTTSPTPAVSPSSPTPTRTFFVLPTASRTFPPTSTTTATALVSPTPTPIEPSATPESTMTETTATPEKTMTPDTTFTATVTPPPCVGDCDVDGSVTVDEIVRMVSIALGVDDVVNCGAADQNDDGDISVDEIVLAVNNALDGCGAVNDERT